MPVFGAYQLTKDWEDIRLYLWRVSDGCLIVEDQQRASNAVKSEKLQMHQEPPRLFREKN